MELVAFELGFGVVVLFILKILQQIIQKNQNSPVMCHNVLSVT